MVLESEERGYAAPSWIQGLANQYVQVGKMAAPVTSLGPGRRFVLWVQGCSKRCPGCASSDMWDPKGGRRFAAGDLAAVIADRVISDRLDGLSVSGGEPARQANALAALIVAVREHICEVRTCRGDVTGFDVLLFSGCSADDIRNMAPGLLDAVDAAACGPYERGCPRAGRLLASGNQQLVIMNESLRNVFEQYNNADNVTLQADVHGPGLSIVGIPDAGDLERIEAALARRGVSLEDVSWR